MDFKNCEPVQMFCNNCANKCIGYRARDETVHISCEQCGTVYITKQKDARTIDIRMIAPFGQTILT